MSLGNTTVFLTGAFGFIGSNLALRLDSLGANVVALRRDEARTDNPLIHKVLEKVSVVRGDLRDSETVMRVINEYEVKLCIHLAAQAIIGVANRSPLSTFSSNIQGTWNLLEACRGSPTVEGIVVASCYDAGTRAVTPEGFKRFDEIAVGDRVLSLDTQGRIVEGMVQEVIVQDYEGPMVHFRGKRLDLMVTPDHRMLLERGDQLEFVPASFPIPPRGWALPSGSWLGMGGKISMPPPPHWNALSLPLDLAPEDLLYLLGVYIGDGHVQHQEKLRPSKTRLAAHEYVAMARASSGRLAAAGGGLQRGRVRTWSNVVYLYVPDDDPCRPRLEAVLSRLGVRFSRWKQGGEGALYFSSAQLAGLLEQAGTRAVEKRIPRWALAFDAPRLLYLLQGILDSDGSRGREVTTISQGLVRDLVELGLKCGYSVSFSWVPPPAKAPTIRGRPVRGAGAYRVYLSNPSRAILPGFRSMEEYSGKAWCLRVPDGNFLVERSGRLAFCGNSDKAYGTARSLPYREEDPLLARNPYDVSKACADLLAQSYGEHYGMPVIISRCSNVYGHGDLNFSRIVPDICRSVALGEPPRLRSDGTMLRDFIHIDDVVRAYEAIAKALLLKRCGREVFNIGSGSPTRVIDMTNLIIETSGKDLAPVVGPAPPKGEILHQYVAVDKIREALGWRPEVDLREGVNSTYGWYSEFFSKRS